MINLTIETTNETLRTKILKAYEYGINHSATANQLMLKLEQKLKGFNVGRGGSHIWIKDENDNRVAIISEMIEGTLR
jgi:hypothetical protein